MTIQAEHSAAFNRVDAAPVDWLSDGELVPELQRLQRIITRAEARRAEIITAAHRRGVPQAQGFGSPTAWLIAVTGDPPPICRSRVRIALALQHMDRTRRTFEAGDLSEAREADPEIFSRDERLLVSPARSLSARTFPKAVAHWRRLADPDGALAAAGRAFECRRLCVSATWQGMVRLDGDLDPKSGA